MYNLFTSIFGESWGLWFTVQIVSTLLPFGTSIVSTYWVLKLENEMNLNKLNNYYEIGEKTTSNNRFGSENSRSRSQSGNNRSRIGLEDILSDDRGFEGFMSHLAREFSMENLLSLVEMTQYQRFIKQWLLNEIEQKNKYDHQNSGHGRNNSLRVRLITPKEDEQYAVLSDHDDDDIDSPNINNNNINSNNNNNVHSLSPPTTSILLEPNEIDNDIGSDGSDIEQNINHKAVQSLTGLADLAMKISVSIENNNNNNDNINNNNNNKIDTNDTNSNNNDNTKNDKNINNNNITKSGSIRGKHIKNLSKDFKNSVVSKLTKFGSNLGIHGFAHNNELDSQHIGLVLIDLPGRNVIPKSSIVWDEVNILLFY